MHHVVYISPTKLLLLFSAPDQMKDFSIEGVLDFKRGAYKKRHVSLFEMNNELIKKL